MNEYLERLAKGRDPIHEDEWREAHAMDSAEESTFASLLLEKAAGPTPLAFVPRYALHFSDTTTDSGDRIPPNISRTKKLDNRLLKAHDQPELLFAILDGGTHMEKRLLLERLRYQISKGGMPHDLLKRWTARLGTFHDLDLLYDTTQVKLLLGVQDAIHEKAEAAKIAKRLEPLCKQFWEETGNEEPFLGLSGDKQALFSVHIRNASPLVISHFCELLESSVHDSRYRMILSMLKYAGDPRLVASLRICLMSGVESLVIQAAQALGRIADPRAYSALLFAYERSVENKTRLELGAALAMHGDGRAKGFALGCLSHDDIRVQKSAFEVMSHLADVDDTAAMAETVTHLDPKPEHRGLAIQACRALARTGSAAAYPHLETLSRRFGSSLAIELEDADRAIRAQIFLRGEVIPQQRDSVMLASAQGVVDRQGDPVLLRIKGWWSFGWGIFFRAFGQKHRAIKQFELAGQRKHSWSLPYIMIATIEMGRKRHAQALSAFRRALEANTSQSLRIPGISTEIARCYLLRADELKREHQPLIAQNILEEALELDLRRAHPALRHQLNIRLQELNTQELSPSVNHSQNH